MATVAFFYYNDRDNVDSNEDNNMIKQEHIRTTITATTIVYR